VASISGVTLRAKTESRSAETPIFHSGMAKRENLTLFKSERVNPVRKYTRPLRERFDLMFAPVGEPIEVQTRNLAKLRRGSKAVCNRNSIYKAYRKLVVV
jgi:hypothetical protein